ncbi:MAG: O-antigen ligase family protein [Myxococcales bacterium]|nr:O-antigen ligase family protein [Myxococcales bacterium]
MSSRRPSGIPAPPDAPNRTAYVARIALVATLVLSPELLGGVFPWTIAIIAGMAATTGFLTGRGVTISSVTRRSARLLDWLVIAALAWTGLQHLPLPAGIVSFFVPESVEAWHAVDALFDRPPSSWVPLSLDPGATRLELAKGSAIVSMYLVARMLAASGRRRWVLIGVGMSGGIMALVAFGHHLSGATEVFGVYAPIYASTRLLAPLMNENHLGGFMALVTPILLGLALDSPRGERQVAWGASAAACAIAGVLSFSRGGILALGLGVGLFLIVHATRRRRQGRSIFLSKRTPVIAIGILVTVALLAVIAGNELEREFSYTDNRTVKLDAAKAALPMIASHWMTGVGRGAFSAAYVGEHGSAKRFFHPENLLVQWTAEWGLVIALALLAVLLWSIGRAFRLRRSHAHLGALAGLVAIGVHQMVDFSLELLGVAVVVAATLGAVADSVTVRRTLSLRTLLIGASVVSLIGVVLAGSLRGRDTFSLERELRATLDARDHARAHELVETGLALHPAEPIFVLVGAELAVRERDDQLVRWINHAQHIAPTWSAPHLLAARWLFSVGRTDQALVELREGESKHPGSMVRSMCALLELQPDIEIVHRVTPPGVAGGRFLDRVAGCLPWTAPLAGAIDASARERDPTLIRPTLRQAKRLMLDEQNRKAIELLTGLPELDATARHVLADAYLQESEAVVAEEIIASLIQQRRPSPQALRTAVAIQIALGHDEQVRSLASRLRSQTNGRKEPLAEIDLFIGGLYEQAARYPSALVAYRRANRIIESRKGLEALARVSAVSGDTTGALLIYQRLCRTDGGTGEACVSAQKLSAERGGPP